VIQLTGDLLAQSRPMRLPIFSSEKIACGSQRSRSSSGGSTSNPAKALD